MHLHEDVEGVRDEIGFLSLHQAYADRFFPGTSVQHTRLRYVLFVPWIYSRLIERGERKQVSGALEKEEIQLAGRLKKTAEKGVIGRDSYPRPTAQPPSMVYWTALATWRILRPYADGSYPTRSRVHRTIARGLSHAHLHDDDRQLMDEEQPLFTKLPTPPKEWSDVTLTLDFQLTADEKTFLRACLLAVPRPGNTQAPSLLSRLVEHGVEMTDGLELWGAKVRAVADADDRDALIRARRVAALSAVGRCVYAALVERMRDEQDGTPTENVHRSNLDKVIDKYSGDALRVETDEIQQDVSSLPTNTLEVLRATLGWLKDGGGDPKPLWDVYQRAEARRKGRRARLTRSLAGRQKRQEWRPDEHRRAEPLHYRWGNVQRLLSDLRGQP
jgi:hypothetical protein